LFRFEKKKEQKMAAVLGAVEALKVKVRKARTFFTEDEVQTYYEIGESLGSGFFATVYKATERKTGELVAIKCIDKAKVADKISMLEEEVSILSRVKHDNCVQMYEIFESQKHVHLVMELVTGGELFDRIMELKVFNEAICAKVVRQICQSLSYLHSLGIVHRDLKPENILLDNPDLHHATVKITDFGLSKIMKGEKKFLHSRCGTPAYAAPELVEGKQYTSKVDMWAVGCLMYVMLCGSPPFKGRDTQELFVHICKGNYSLQTKPFTVVSTEAKNFIKKLLVLDPSKRLSAEEALLDPWLKGKMQRQESLMMHSHLKNFQEEQENYVRDYKNKIEVDPNAPQKPKRGPSEIGIASSSSSPSSAFFSSRLGSSSDSSLRISDDPEAEAKGVIGKKVSVDAIEKMEDKYEDWPSFAVEYRQGNLLGCRDPDQIKKILSNPSPSKRRAKEAGYIRPFLLLASMHPRQRLGCAAALDLDLTVNLWYGDPHREAWEIVSHSLEGLRRKTGGSKAFQKGTAAPFWWDTVLQVATKTLTHFWSAEKEAKNALKSVPTLTRDQIRDVCSQPGKTHLTDLEELFLSLVFKKLMKDSGTLDTIKYRDSADLAKAMDGPDKEMIEAMKRDFSATALIVKFLNFYDAKAYRSSTQSDAFMSWAEKERQPTMSSVFLNKLPVRSLLPTIVTICAQRLFLAAIGITISDFMETDNSSLDGSKGKSSKVG